MLRSAFPGVVVFFLFSCVHLQAQGFQLLFLESNGEPLLDSLFIHYKPGTVLDYTQARDTLYAKVLAKDDDTLRCIYTGYGLYLDPTQDPTQYVYLNGSSLGMNAEHAYPQSKGAAEGNARSDMHHLYPARIPVNEARGDVPYANIPDAQTQKWFIGAQIYTSIPTQNIDLYAESRTGAFEPRESVKGDLARAIFYFYTMYRSQANLADPNFFESQRPTLCQWDAQDPADQAELTKTWRIAPYQEGKPNPYIVDCTLAHRTWCPEVVSNCLLGTNEAASRNALQLRISPNPVGLQARLEMNLPFAGDVKGRIINVLGQEISSFEAKDAQSGGFVLPLDFSNAGTHKSGLCFLEVQVNGKTAVAIQSIPFVME